MLELGENLAMTRGCQPWVQVVPGDSLCFPSTAMSLRKCALALALSSAAIAPASAQTLQNIAGTSFYAPAIGNYATLGSDLFGMLVTGRFSDGQTFSANWGNLAGGLSGVQFAGRFSLTVGTTSDTWSTPFDLTVFGTSNRLDVLTLTGSTGPVVFDRTFGGTVGTAASQSGRDFAYVGTSDLWNTLVSYRNAVQMVGSGVAVGDIYETMVIAFQSGVTGTSGGQLVRFRQDMDNVIAGGLILPVPEPDGRSLTVFGSLVGCAVFARRRRRLPVLVG
jgi:hypothetical protein